MESWVALAYFAGVLNSVSRSALPFGTIHYWNTVALKNAIEGGERHWRNTPVPPGFCVPEPRIPKTDPRTLISMIDPATQPPALRTIAMPKDANPQGDIFGGWLLSQMDMAGGSAATERARGRVVTIAIDAMTFHQPVEGGDEVSCYAAVRRVGRTSIVVDVEAWKRRQDARERIKVTEGVFTYVRIDDNRKPTPVPEELGSE